MKLFLVTSWVAVASGCQKEPPRLELLAAHTFAEFSRNQPAGLDLRGIEGRALLVRVEGFETDFESSVVKQDGETLSLARLPYVRNGPVFHIVVHRPGVEAAGVVVQPVELTQNARITATIYQLPDDSRGDRLRIEAYKAYEAATQSTADESPDLWRERAELLRTAASGFKRTGDSEEQLWAEYLEAYVSYFPLAEYKRAAEMAADVQRRARRHGFREIELMAAQLEGQALIERSEGDALQTAQAKAERAQAVLERAANLAAEMGYEYERAWALNTRGIGYFYQDRYAEAEQQYRRALEIAIEIQDSGLPKQVRGNLALVRERLGDLRGALAELLEINAHLQEGGATVGLANNWSELSRLYERLYLFPESIDAQKRALELWRELNSAEGMGRSGLSLAHAYQAIGNLQTALSALHEGIHHMGAAGYARGLREGFGLMAELYRMSGQFDEMARERERQTDYLNSDTHLARHQYERGLDALAQFPEDERRAAQFFAEVVNLANRAGDSGLELRARLQFCAIAEPETENCAVTELKSALDEWLPMAPPSQAFDARYLFARRLANLGSTAEAWEIVDGLVDDIQFYRNILPGVLGAWYWEGRARIFYFYMQLALHEGEARSDRGARSLLAFNRLLNASPGIEPSASSASGTADSGQLETLRGLLAQLDSGETTDAPKLRQAIDRQLLAFGNLPSATAQGFDEQELLLALRSLPAERALLAYFLAPGESWVWLATREGVQLESLGSDRNIADALGRVRSGLRAVGNNRLDDDLERAGELLLGPIRQDLPEAVYLLVAGQFAGFPFEAIRRNGRYFGQDHAVINLLSLESLSRSEHLPGNVESWQSLVLAGDPVRAQDGISELPAASRELDGLIRLFDGKSVIRRSGDDLELELFHGPPFTTADLIHLSSHARIDLEYPELSRLKLSAGERVDVFLTPLDLRGSTIQADLVVLSACETTGVNRFSFDSNLGFVHAFLSSGAGAVVATLWPVADAFAADFMLDFYAAMVQGANAPEALAQVKRRHIAQAAASGKLDWPAFQIYIN